MAPKAVRYQAPAPHLRAFITTYYWVDIPPGVSEQSDWLLPEWPNIRFILGGGWRVRMPGTDWRTPGASSLFGPTGGIVPVAGSSPSRLVGLGLLPLGYAALFDTEAAALADRLCALDDHMDGVADLHAALAAAADDEAQAVLLDAYFTARFAARPPPPDLLRRAHAVLLDPETTTVEAFAGELGVSSRHLLRLCRRLFGFPPKLLLRRQRFMRTLDTATAELGRPFGEILDSAYFDQSHFVRDFHLFMGFSPTQYFNLHRPLQSIAQRERLKALGASFQDLHAARMAAAGESGSSKSAARRYG